MEFAIIPKQEAVPSFDAKAVQVRYLEYGGKTYRGGEITEARIMELLRKLPSGMDAVLYLDPDGEDNWMEVLCDGEWLALGYSGDFGEENFYSYNPAFAGSGEKTPLKSGGQSPGGKMLAIQDLETGARAVEYFIRTGELYPGMAWARQLT